VTPGQPSRVVLRRTGDTVEVEGATYRWSWSTVTDEVTLRDRDGRVCAQRSGGSAPRASAHLLGGGTIPVDGRFDGEHLSLEVLATTPDGTPVELIEVRFD
jgi:hypothetical protein